MLHSVLCYNKCCFYQIAKWTDTRSEIFTDIAKINFRVAEVSHIMGCNACLLYCSEAFGQYDVGAIFLLRSLLNYQVSPSLTKWNSDFLCQRKLRFCCQYFFLLACNNLIYTGCSVQILCLFCKSNYLSLHCFASFSCCKHFSQTRRCNYRLNNVFQCNGL